MEMQANVVFCRMYASDDYIYKGLQSVSWSLAEFRHNKIVQSPHDMSTTQRKVRSREDDNYSNWVIINYGVYKGLYHIYFLLIANNKTIHSPTSRIVISCR